MLGSAVSLHIRGVDASPTETLRYGASGLPAGLAINAASGLISGRPVTTGRST